MIDVIVCGSGASAVHAAWPLVKAGLEVLLLDAGFEDERYTPLIPDRDFVSIRRESGEQHRFLLGEEFEGIPLGPVRVGAQLTPPRQHIARHGEDLLPIDSGEFHAMQSLALGGLAAGWGAAVPPFSEDDLVDWPIRRGDLQPHYEAVAERIGISGPKRDDLSPFLDPSPHLLPPAKPDSNAAWIYKRYARHRDWFQDRGLYAGLPRLAMATREHRGRGPLRYDDMEFWADRDRAAYRPVYTLEELKQYRNFTCERKVLVKRFRQEEDGTVRVEARSLADENTREYRAARLVLACGTLGTARIVLESAGAWRHELPLVSNPYTYFPCLVYSRLGRPTRNRRHSLTQLMMLYDPDDNPAKMMQAQVYSYRSLLTFKLVKESPLPFPQSVRLMRMLQEYFVIVGVHHEDRPATGKYLFLEEGGDGRMHVCYRPSNRERETRQRRERALMSLFPWLACLPLRRIDPGDGSSIHYAGCVPMTEEELPFTTRPDGRLRGAESVVIADGAAFPHLPAKGLTYTLMANADRVGTLLARELKG